MANVSLMDDITQSSYDDTEDKHTTTSADFMGKMDNAKTLANLLSSIHFKKDQYCQVRFHQDSIMVVVEDCKSVIGVCDLRKDLFQDYTLSTTVPIAFGISLTSWIDCLTIFGGGTSFTSLQMLFQSKDGPPRLCLMMEENDVRTNCILRVTQEEEIPNYDFDAYPVRNAVSMKADILKEVLNELDWSSEHLTLLLSPDPPYFRLTTSGPSGSCLVDYPKDSEAFDSFECTTTQSFSYQMKLLQPAIKALSFANKTTLLVNQRGVLRLIHSVPTEDGQTIEVEFYVLSLDEDVIHNESQL